jgi:uncharacterized protein
MQTAAATHELSEQGRQRLLSRRAEPLFLARWDRAVFLHYEADPAELQRLVPFPLELWHGRAFVSLVAFTMRGMRPRFGGSLGKLLVAPIATCAFLNVRTYVRCGEEPGIYFLAEWLSSRLSTMLGPLSFGLPYRFGELQYQHEHESGRLSGSVAAGARELRYSATIPRNENFTACEAHTLDEFLLERYTAFTQHGSSRRFFRIWHPPWPQTRIAADVPRAELLDLAAEFRSANYSPGLHVWMGWPHRLRG